MARVPEYERLQIESILQPGDRTVEQASGVLLMPSDDRFRRVYDAAVRPALYANRMAVSRPTVVFASEASLVDVCHWLLRTEVLIADLTDHNPDLMYVLGLAHGLGRCPILICQEPGELPFNLGALRCVEYESSRDGLVELRERLTRAVRVLVTATRGPDTRGPEPPGD